MGETPQVYGLILCRGFSATRDGKNQNLTDVFWRTSAENFPHSLNDTCIFAQISRVVVGDLIQTEIGTTAGGSKAELHRFTVGKAQETLPDCQGCLCLSIPVLTFSAPGSYVISLLVNGELISQGRLDVGKTASG